uniref:Coatomer subunit delta n=1 Tax=Ditylum brightwellii TaxID=49249 RepID=A0A6S8RZN8_9STRA|mmetsp:Transcript_2165/g.3360  ORF Transcript_2165/g.3360 Transcript_2165/m.3360 type:complete len:544 (-) Transcript_2165:186-1817(-)
MVVLSASICTRGGKALVSRQFVEMNRMRVEGLLAAFPKLMGHSKQHTFVETDTVRYVYQPLENQLYLLLVTTKASNIVEDLGTLRLLAKVVPDVAGGVQENSINEHAFELIFAFDEVLTSGGYKEEATLSSIRTNLQMESHEENMHNMIKESKEKAAAEEGKRQAKAMQEKKMAALRNNFMSGQNGFGGPAPGAMEGFGGGGQPNNGGIFEGFGGHEGGGGGYDPYGGAGGHRPSQPKAPEPEAPRVVAKGMKLGNSMGKKKDNLMAMMAAEDNLTPFSMAPKNDALGLSSAAAPVAAPPSAPVSLILEEKVSVSMNREGGIESCDVKGTLTLTANTDVGTAAIVAVNKAELAAKCTSNWGFATHPKVNKPTYEKQGVLSLKKGGFPLNRPVGILRWNYSGEDAAPLTVNCWPEDEGSGSINVNIEFELNRPDMVLNDVNILLPLGTTDPPAIEQIDGQYKVDSGSGVMCWHHDIIDSNNSSGSLEFSIGGSNVDAFFPCEIRFSSQSLLCPIQVSSVTSSANGGPIPANTIISVVPDAYQCA